jgi:hypothetical protein
MMSCFDDGGQEAPIESPSQIGRVLLYGHISSRWGLSATQDRLVATGVVEAVRDQMMHALAAHVGEIHRRAGKVLRLCHGCEVSLRGQAGS